MFAEVPHLWQSSCAKLPVVERAQCGVSVLYYEINKWLTRASCSWIYDLSQVVSPNIIILRDFQYEFGDLKAFWAQYTGSRKHFNQNTLCCHWQNEIFYKTSLGIQVGTSKEPSLDLPYHVVEACYQRLESSYIEKHILLNTMNVQEDDRNSTLEISWLISGNIM